MVPLMSRMVPDIVLVFYRFRSDFGDEAERKVFCLNVSRNKFGNTSVWWFLAF
jgi:hypothetical protein